MESSDVDKIVKALVGVKIAVESLNPDPMQTIQQHRDREARRDRMMMFAVVISVVALIVSVGQCWFRWLGGN